MPMWSKSFYTNRPTLAELHDELGDELFSGLDSALPAGVTADTLHTLLLEYFGELDTICKTAEGLQGMITAWAATLRDGWAHMAAALSAEYDPLSNYDRTDSETESITGTGSGTTSSTSGEGGTDTVTNGRQGFNSSAFVGTEDQTTAYGRTTQQSGTASNETSTDRTKTLRSSGNIGVTTSQQMLESEMELRTRWTMYGVICGAFQRDICVEVW